jgi:hypothetical protein
MSSSVKRILDAFDRLSNAEQREAAAAILNRTLQVEPPPLDDATLCQRADEDFQALDAREAAYKAR